MMVDTNSKPDTPETVLNVVKTIISTLKGIKSTYLANDKGLWEYGLDIVDLVDLILAVEMKDGIVIPDEVPVYTINDFANYIALHQHKG